MRQVWFEGGFFGKFKPLLLLTLTLCLRHAFAVRVLMPLLGPPQEVAEEGRPDVPSGTSLSVPLYKEDRGERHI